MADNARITLLNRRSLIVAATLGTLALPRTIAALAEEPRSVAVAPTRQFDDALAELLAGATPAEGLITLEVPEVAENGNFVPLTVSVTSPMTDADYVKTIHILSSGNPVARVAAFHLSPINGTARVQSRMRLAKTQDVYAIAVLSNGSLAIGQALVKVTIGGCAS
ncbi:MAG: thiosulfate oxidation carrier protein SoxY [Hyphomicrobium sp.]